eukprot:1156371-Pelagomonas_calceolata.AAC.2
MLPVNRGSLSVMSFLGSPNRETFLSRKSDAAPVELTSVVVGAKRTYLESLSTKTMIASWPLGVLGRCVIRSIVTCSQRLP